jgi:hypothetical protein
MAFGIDTFRTRLDLLLPDPTQNPPRTSQELDYFKQWNGGTVTLPDSEVVGGDPAFAGRNFLGGDFIWGHAEHTNAFTEPDGATFPLATNAPSPDQPQNLQLTVNLIAPVQAPQSARQQQTGERGIIYGQIDAQAICNRILACIPYELFFPSSYLTYIWLAVDPDVGFSADYWAGWSDFINTKTYTAFGTPGIQPFRACILCSYAASDGVLHPDPNVTAALNDNSHPGLNTKCFAFWADAHVGADTAGALTPNPTLNWNSFDPKAVPVLWRLKNGFTLSTDPSAPPVSFSFDADAINPNPNPAPTNFMLTANRWQPNVSSISNIGFITAYEVPAAAVTCILNNLLPNMQDNSKHPSTVIGGQAKVIGRYLKTPGHGTSMSAAEAQRLSGANFSLFTIWESFNIAAGGEPTLDQNKVATWGAFNANIHKNIYYFDPAHHAGTEDGQNAFSYCGGVLKQPPHTPVFFAVDFDPLDLPDPNSDPSPPPGWPTLPNATQRRQWIEQYFELIKAARDAYAITNPDRFYEIGVYGCGAILQWCYEQGIASSFWQAVSSGHNGSKPPRWPWYHCNRWQYQFTGDKHSIAWTCATATLVQGPDPDADWGDGGTWSLTDPITARLNALGQATASNDIGSALQNLWGGLVDPAPLPAAVTT